MQSKDETKIYQKLLIKKKTEENNEKIIAAFRERTLRLSDEEKRKLLSFGEGFLFDK